MNSVEENSFTSTTHGMESSSWLMQSDTPETSLFNIASVETLDQSIPFVNERYLLEFGTTL